MAITRQGKNILIEASGSINMEAVQKLIDYVNVLEIASHNQGTEEQAAELEKSTEISGQQISIVSCHDRCR